MAEKVHRGDFMRAKIDKTGWSVNETSQRMGIGYTTLYRWLENPNMPFNQMKKIADVVGYDLTEDFPDAEIVYKKEPPVDQTKYVQLMEKHLQTQDELIKCKNTIAEQKHLIEELQAELAKLKS